METKGDRRKRTVPELKALVSGADEARELLSPEELAGHLGCSRTNAYRLLREREIPSFRIGALRRVRRQDVDTYIDRQLEDAI